MSKFISGKHGIFLLLTILGCLITPNLYAANKKTANIPPANHTGLTINTENLRFKALPTVRVYAATGQVIFKTLRAQYVNGELISQPNLPGSNPLLVHALRVKKISGKTSELGLVISQKEAQSLIREKPLMNLINRTKLVLVLILKSATRDSTSLKNSLGILKEEWAILSRNSDFLAKLKTLSSPAKTLYRNLSYFDKIKLNDKIHGVTELVVGSINNKEAFITGKAKDKDTFQYLQQNNDQDLKDGLITLEQHDQRTSSLQILSKLTSDERAILVALLEQELQARQSNSAVSP